MEYAPVGSGDVLHRRVQRLAAHHSPTSTTALITPVSGRVYDGNTSIRSSNAVRCVIHGRVSIVPSSISRMMWEKSDDRALREQSRVPSGRWKIGWRNVTGSVVMP